MAPASPPSQQAASLSSNAGTSKPRRYYVSHRNLSAEEKKALIRQQNRERKRRQRDREGRKSHRRHPDFPPQERKSLVDMSQEEFRAHRNQISAYSNKKRQAIAEEKPPESLLLALRGHQLSQQELEDFQQDSLSKTIMAKPDHAERNRGLHPGETGDTPFMRSTSTTTKGGEEHVKQSRRR